MLKGEGIYYLDLQSRNFFASRIQSLVADSAVADIVVDSAKVAMFPVPKRVATSHIESRGRTANQLRL